MNKSVKMPLMCNWCMEDDIGWFVAYSLNILYKYDMQKEELSAVSAIPTDKLGSYQNPLCVKYKNFIYCIPYYANSIWCYNLVSGEWSKTVLCDESSSIVACLLGIRKGVCYFFSMEFRTIYGLDLATGTIKFTYIVGLIESVPYSRFDGILKDSYIYLVVGGAEVYEFNLDTQEENKFDLCGIDDTLYKIIFCEDSFWLLGKKKEIYIWNKEKNCIHIINSFPEGFKLYDFANKAEIIDLNHETKDLIVFAGICCLNGKVWIIPQSGNKIIYFVQSEKKIRAFEMQEEEESIETLDLCYRYMAAKFFLVYVREERYLGIYSYKNKRIFEIDTLYMTYKNMETIVDIESLSKISIQDFYEDGDETTYLTYAIQMESLKSWMPEEEFQSIGERIYHAVVK